MTEALLGSAVLVALMLALAGIVVAARRALMPERPALVTLNGARRIEAVTGRKLLGVLTGAGVPIPSACAGAGTCGLCRVQIVAGGPDPLPIETARLAPAEVRDGVHLACQVTLRGDMGVAVPHDLLAAESFECRAETVRPLTPSIREITLVAADGHRPDLFAGCFVQVTAPPYELHYSDIEVPPAHEDRWTPLRGLRAGTDEPVTRAYSVAGRPEDAAAGRIVLDIRLALPPPSVPGAPPGIVSSWLFSLRPGDAVPVAGPFGTFRLSGTDAEIVLMGGGVGIAPMRSMIWDALERQGTARRISFWYGARSRADLLYAAEMDDLAARHPGFDWTPVLSDPKPGGDWDGATGFVHAAAYERYLRDHPAPEECEFYLCGPPLMIAATLRMLDDLGVEPDRIFNDDFGV